MKNKPTIIATSLLISSLILASYTIRKTGGSHPGSTGAPGDDTCAQSGCHSDAQVVHDTTGVNTLVYSQADSTYVPGQSYTLTLKVNSLQTEKFGFELTALKNADTKNAGVLNILEPVRTQTISRAVNGDLRYSATHDAPGTTSLSAGYTEWKMKWTAPATNQGPITFYYATNCTNNDGQVSGDKIYLSSFSIKPVVTNTTNTTLIEDLHLEKRVRIFFNKDSKHIALNYSLTSASHVKISVSDCLGSTIYESPSELKSGEQNQTILLAPNYTKGAYIVKLAVNNSVVRKKIIVD